MEILRKLAGLYHWLLKRDYFLFWAIVLANVVLHLVFINKPDGIMFDEEHYVKDARSIIAGEGDFRPEHPPLAKLIISSGMLLFGDNPFGWRIMGVFFGAVAIVFFYLICRELKLTRRTSLLATFLLAFDNLMWAQAGIAMLDVYMMGFIMVALWLYVKRWYPLAAVAAALAALCKLTGAMIIPAMVLHWALTRRDKPFSFLAMLFAAGFSFAGLLAVFNWVPKHVWTSPITSINTMLAMSGSLKFENVTHPSLSRPWDWIMPWQMFNLPWEWAASGVLNKENLDAVVMPYWYTPHYYGAVSFSISFLVLPAVAYLVWRALKKSAHGRWYDEDNVGVTPRSAAVFALAWFAATYVVWIPMSILTNRVSFIFYFYPAIGSLCLAIAMGISYLVKRGEMRRRGKLRMATLIGVPAFLVFHVVVFVVLSPLTHLW